MLKWVVGLLLADAAHPDSGMGEDSHTGDKAERTVRRERQGHNSLGGTAPGRRKDRHGKGSRRGSLAAMLQAQGAEDARWAQTVVATGYANSSGDK